MCCDLATKELQVYFLDTGTVVSCSYFYLGQLSYISDCILAHIAMRSIRRDLLLPL